MDGLLLVSIIYNIKDPKISIYKIFICKFVLIGLLTRHIDRQSARILFRIFHENVHHLPDEKLNFPDLELVLFNQVDSIRKKEKATTSFTASVTRVGKQSLYHFLLLFLVRLRALSTEYKS